MNIRRKLFVVALIAVLWGLPMQTSAHPVTRYQWFTNIDVHQGEPWRYQYHYLWYWTVDTLYGDFRSNDVVLLKLSPHFYGRFMISAPDYWRWNASPYFEYEPIFNAPLFELPRSFPHLQDRAQLTFTEQEYFNYLPRVHLAGEDGVEIYIRANGLPRNENPFNDSLWATLDAPLDDIICFEGNVELEGVLDGQLTIYATGDIVLLDNVLYSTANEINALFDEDNTDDMLALVAGENIIIANTVKNGRENGYRNRNNFDRHSISLNGSLMALHGGFTFEQQNHEWERYQGPTPDERGHIYHKGSIAQWRRGYMHISAHDGTGYGKAYYYDSRLLTDGPPGFAPGEYPYWEGQIPSQRLGWLDEYTFENATLDSLTIDPGVTVLLKDGEALTIGDHFEVNGTTENPVTFRTQALNGRAIVRVHVDAADALIRHARFEGNVELICNAESADIDSSSFSARVSVDSETLTLSHNTFYGQVNLSYHNDLLASRNLMLGGLIIPASDGVGLVINNTIVGANRTGIVVQQAENLEITNNIIAYNRHSIDSRSDGGVSVRYCDVFGNAVDEYYGCVPGEGCLSLDPLFVDAENGDFHLAVGSPCIDAGDPELPNDPDGTRTDMGAYPFDHAQDVASESAFPSAFALFAPYPNPFNSTTTIGYSLPAAGNVSLAVYDLSGREVARLVDSEQLAGNHEVVWTADGIASGVYMVKLNAGGVVAREKVVLVK